MTKVMGKTEIMETAQALFPCLDADTYPECRKACDWILQTNGDPELAQQYADRLSQSDRKQELPSCVGDFIVDLYETAITLTESAAAMLNLGAFYYMGRSGTPDYEKAVTYYRMAAERGESIALENLGYCYYYGRSVEADDERAYYYFSQAAMLGRPTALYKIGDMYRYGKYLPQQDGYAFAFYRKSLECIDEDSAETAAGPVFLRLGDCYRFGLGTQQDARLALEYYQAAERHLYDMVAGGDSLYRSSLQRAVEGQEAVRHSLYKTI